MRPFWSCWRLPVTLVCWCLTGGLLSLTPAMAAEDVRLNLRDAELRAFIELVAQVTGRNFIVDPSVQGAVTIIAPEPMAPEAVYKIFLNVLQINRFAIVEGDGADRIVPMQLARELPYEAEQHAARQPQGFVTRVLKVEHTPLEEAMQVIRPLVPAEAVLTAYPTGRLLILSDREANIGRIEALLARLDRPYQQEIEILPLQNAVARYILDTLVALQVTFPGSKVTADTRSNALLVSGTQAFREQVRRLATRLDRPYAVTDATVVRLRYADAVEIEAVISKLLAAQPGEGGSGGPGGMIIADEATNSLLISAPPNRLSSLITTVKALDQRPSQVLVEGVIFEMSAEKFAELGVQFHAVISDIFIGGSRFLVGEAPNLGSLVTAILAGNTPSFGAGLNAVIGNPQGNGIIGFIAALARDATTNILATPSILTLDSKTAEMVVAQNVPFVTGRFSTVGETANPDKPFQTIQREDIGLTLRVTPHITGDDSVRLHVEQEVSSLTTAAAAAGSEITQRRAIDTNILVGDRRLVLLGGLLEDQSSNTGAKVPGLGDLPVFKYLFGTKASRDSKRILLLLLRPTIIRSDTTHAEVTEDRYNRARAGEAAALLGYEHRYPRSQPHRLSVLAPTLGPPFRTVVASEAGGRQLPALMPRLPPRLRFERE